MTKQSDEAAVDALVNTHKALALPVEGPVVAPSSNGPAAYRIAKQACLRLGFIEIDAQAVAQAWARQTERAGQFDGATWPCHPADFGMPPEPRPNASPTCPQSLGLYAVLPDSAWVGRMARAGVPCVQLRFKSEYPQAIQREVNAAVEAVKGTASLLFINDHWQAAMDAGAYGVHLGQEDLALADLAAIREAGLRLGLSSHGYAEMLKADQFSPSYIAMGAVYATTLKRMVTPPQGPARLAAYARLLNNAELKYPLVAIGGVDEARLDAVLASGVGSVAVVRALVAADDPESVAKRWVRKIHAII